MEDALAPPRAEDLRARSAREMGFSVRKATPRDARRLVELARAVGSEPEGWLVANGEWRSVGDERRYLRAVRNTARAAVFVAETPRGPVGRLSVARDYHPASFHVADVGIIVARQERGRGIGRVLMRTGEEWARAVGILKLELHVFPHNEPARALYESLGYRQEGLRLRHFKRGDAFVDAILMAKELS